MSVKSIFERLIGHNGLLSKPRRNKKDEDSYDVRVWLYGNKERVLKLFVMLYEDEADITKVGGIVSELSQAKREIDSLRSRNSVLRRNNNIANSKMVAELRQKISDLHFRIEVLQQFHHTEFKSPTAEESQRAGRDVEEAQKIISKKKKEKEKER